VDLAYGDDTTPLLQCAGKAGAATVDGMEILVRQGARSLRIWTGLEAPLAAMREAVKLRN
jgi:shikimate dehydrogenase